MSKTALDRGPGTAVAAPPVMTPRVFPARHCTPVPPHPYETRTYATEHHQP
ncbi:hypothetical protein [Streptomyces sp. NPDC059928]|uniref:hypothetical protein n=1 Tax=unclassified Streptomyces TaxID=2593676 RepID=UPI00365F8668